jgi:tripeptidyl-peptidase-2
MKLKIAVIILISLITLSAQDSVQTFLSLSNTGVAEFLKIHPEYDGRGTIILILDTGVDMGIEGLQKTSTGETKVIDVRDFTGEGDINLYDCKTEEQNGKEYFINEDKNLKVAGADRLKYKAVDDKYCIGALKETDLKNSMSHTEDLNGNGSDSDKYVVVAFQIKDSSKSQWVAYFDTNDNGDLSDEKPIENYNIKFDTFHIPNDKGLPQLTFAINIFPDQKKISLHFDDGAHGTNVAGIAAGYHIGGTYLDGVAPGANIISLKIGNNKYSGGATVSESMKKAFLFADKISKERSQPCIINMSYGIGSEIEGKADIELFLDTLLLNNPYLYVCISNGNDGPGISTAGLPAASGRVLSSGAVLPKEVGRDLYGTELKKDIVFFFSSRGGEVAKPDICSPGASASTVPNWSTGDRMAGTSMASPYTAGVLSLLMSGIVKEYPEIKIPSFLLYKAIRNSAVNMEGYTLLDEGAGYINVNNAFTLLKKYIDMGEVKNFESYSISSFAPNMPDGKAPNLYIRNGSYLTGNEIYNYVIKRDNVLKKDQFFRIYNIKSNSDWLIPIQKKIHIRNNQTASVSVRFDMDKIKAPGLYVGKITGTRDDKTGMPEFQMWATVVMPYQFNQSNNYTQAWQNKQIAPGDIERYFIEVPAGGTAMDVSLSGIKNEFTYAYFRLFKPGGEELYVSRALTSEDNGGTVENNFYNITPGVYELDVEGSYRTGKISNYNLSVGFSGIERLDSGVLDSAYQQIKIINLYNNSDTYNLSGKILGYENDIDIELNGQDTCSIPFILRRDEALKEFTVTLSKGDFEKITDFSLIIFDKEGSAKEKEALTYSDGNIDIENTFNADSVKLRLMLIPAFANKPGKMTIHLKEKTFFNYPIQFNVSDNSKSSTTLYPDIEKTLDCEFFQPYQFIPENASPFGKVYFESELSDKIKYEISVYFNF